tara:strand:+ start:277 stop:4698 length:4422 start_codon:yes stop_codon:yes gene_type:complete
MAGGNNFDVKIGYNKRAAAQIDLTTTLQDIEGVQLTDETGADLITEVEGFVVSELTSEKSLSIGLPTETRVVNQFFSFLFGGAFETKRRVLDANGNITTDAFIKITDPDPTWKFIQRGFQIEAATGGLLYEADGTTVKGNSFETFVVKNVVEEGNVGPSGEFVVRFELEADPSFDDDTPGRQAITYIRRFITKERTGVLPIAEQFASSSEVSSSLLGIDRAETQLGLFSNVSTYGFDTDSFVFYVDNPSDGPGVWVNREDARGETHFPARIEEVKNEGALKICSYPVPYKYPYPPLSQNIINGTDVNGLYNADKWAAWQNWCKLGKTLYEYYTTKRDEQVNSSDPNSNYVRYDSLRIRFLPAINLWDDLTYYNNANYGGREEAYYKQISVWTDTWHLIEKAQLDDPVSGQPIDFTFLNTIALQLRGTGTALGLGEGSVESEGAVGPNRDLNPFEEQWVNSPWADSSVSGGQPDLVDFQPGYGETGGHFALLQSRQAFRYQPGRISGYTFGTRATLEKNQGDNYAEWGIFNDFDEYVFRREGANFFIVRRSNIPYPATFLRELGAVDELGNENPEIVTNYTKEISGKTYNMQEVKLGREKFNGDSLNGNGPSGYLLTTDEITMYKIEFGWYGAIGLRLYAYVPVENGEARWIVVHTFVIENKLNVPSMGDPFFKFKYEVKIGDGQGADLTEPQVLYKYGTSMYIDGGDEGTVSVFTETSDNKLLPSTGEYTSLFGVYPKSDIVSGGGDLIPNKKIIIPKQMSITADGFAEISVFKCRGCSGSQFLYLPNVEAGTFGEIRKMYKANINGTDSDLTLAPIEITASAAGTTNAVTTTDSDVQYLRSGDYLLDTDTGGTLIAGVVASRITAISENAGTYTITLQSGDNQSFANASNLVFQPTFITTDAERREFELDVSDFEAKLIYPNLFNTYIGAVRSGAKNQTVNLLQYIVSNRHSLITERKLDPAKNVSSTNPVTPSNFFGNPNVDTFDVRLSKAQIVVGSPNPVTGPTASLKWLNRVPRDGNQVAEWRMGFTPNKPLFAINGELTGWERPDGTTVTEDRNGTPTNVVNLPEEEYVSLDYHQYETDTSTLGFEQGEQWRAFIHPFREDFRIANPPGSNSGFCSEMRLTKANPISVSVTEVTSATLQALSPTNGGIPLQNWSGFTTASEIDSYLASHSFFLTATAPIIGGARSPKGGQLALNKNNVFDVNFYDSTPTAQDCRFTDVQISYQTTDGNQNTITNYIVPISLSIYGSFTSDGVTPIVTNGSEFLIAYNKVTLSAWFSSGNRYDTPNSYTTGPRSDGIFEFSAFPLYPFAFMRDQSSIRSMEVHNTDLLGNISTFNPEWKYKFRDGQPMVTYNAGSNLQTGQLNADNVGSLNQTPNGIDDLVPTAFSQVNRLSSSQIDKQGESLLRPGDQLTTLYINNETRTFDLTDVFGFDRKVITPDIVNTEAVFFVGRSLANQPVNIQVNLTYVEQL